ncbi:hypothetical protein LG200_04410 [Methylobacillus caricis]|uniref:hypothetical protein n=1 Tax=Methylobacillus caricis TaxID=1971611 RepID=UPI001CFF96AD|nr:hypothetical protein [Methylobacillus caricis]MCB5187248.1 hypothetical protein [Methylobacillus caricis]
MAFVNELINEEDKKRIDWSKFKAWAFSQPHKPMRWTIDRDRNFFFVFLDGPGREHERPEIYVLYFEGNIIRVEAEVSSKGNPLTGSDVLWNIFNVNIPVHIEKKRDEILTVLQEAIYAHGALYRINPVNSVHIEFSHCGGKS